MSTKWSRRKQAEGWCSLQERSYRKLMMMMMMMMMMMKSSLPSDDEYQLTVVKMLPLLDIDNVIKGTFTISSLLWRRFITSFIRSFSLYLSQMTATSQELAYQENFITGWVVFIKPAPQCGCFVRWCCPAVCLCVCSSVARGVPVKPPPLWNLWLRRGLLAAFTNAPHLLV